MLNGDISNEISPGILIDAEGFVLERIERQGAAALAARATHAWKRFRNLPPWPPLFRPNAAGCLVLQRLEQRARIILLCREDDHAGMLPVIEEFARFPPLLKFVSEETLVPEIYGHNIFWIFSNIVDPNSEFLSGKIPVKRWGSHGELLSGLKASSGPVVDLKNLVQFPDFGVG